MFQVNPLPSRDSLEISSHLFSLKNNEKLFMNVVCCSRVWRFRVNVVVVVLFWCTVSCMVFKCFDLVCVVLPN